ncbi:MAG: cyclic nucleotide-binding domain-containing protein [Rhodospirillaceae bacterium]|nr:cyclic nucleotide-binding domain-containing protein [Rhodospirillaceae bacterium]
MEGLGKLLKDHPFFADWSDDYRELIAGCAANHRFAAGEYIARAGKPAEKFYLIRHGTVALETPVPGNPPLLLETLHEGDVFGWSWLVPPYQWTYDVKSTDLCRVLSMDATCLRAKCEADHSLGYQLFKRFIPIIAARMHASQMRLLDLYGPKT